MNRLLQMIAAQPWAIWEPKAREILAYLDARMSGLEPVQQESRLTKRRESEARKAPGNIAVIRVHGVISNRTPAADSMSMGRGTYAEQLRSTIQAAYDDPDTKAIVLDMNSPGGSAAGTPELGDVIAGLRGGEKPIVAHVDNLAASAAYWLAAQADEIIATPSSQVGSIGVIAVHEDISTRLETEGIKETIISAGEFKAEGNMFEPLSDEARSYMQKLVDDYYAMFIDAVATGRGVTKSTVLEDFGQGRVMLAKDALARGMIDRIGTLDETLLRFGAQRRSSGGNRTRAGARAIALETRRMAIEREKAQS